jgi:hypothetical protein
MFILWLFARQCSSFSIVLYLVFLETLLPCVQSREEIPVSVAALSFTKSTWLVYYLALDGLSVVSLETAQ